MSKPKHKGAVAAGHRLTAEAAASVLRDGGNAFDAAITALAMACVCEPVLCSPGGGGFAMIRDGHDGRTRLLDFFPHTPKQKRQPGDAGINEVIVDFGTATQAFHIGPGTVATPGFFAGIEALHLHGSGIALADLLAAAARSAREGIPVSPFQHYLSTIIKPILIATDAARAVFAPDGDVIAAGELLRNPGLADAFEIMASDGYVNSAIGAALLEMQAETGNLTANDLAGFEAIERRPQDVAVGEARVHLNPLPAASGVLVKHALNGLEGTAPADFARALDVTDMARRKAGTDLASLLEVPLRQRGTTHVSVVDGDGNAVAVTISNGEGNGEIVGEFGFMPNNILGEEDVNPQGSVWPQDTRLSSMMCPALIESSDGRLIALGSGGSNRIRSALFQTIARTCLRGETLEDAIHAPRIHVERRHADFEDFFPDNETATLRATFKDHRAWPERNMFFGGVHAVSVDADGTFHGVGDKRRDGVAIVVE